MGKSLVLLLLYSLLLSSLVLSCHAQDRKLHVVYMGARPREDISVASQHHSMLHEAIGSSSLAKESLVHSYERSFNGFAARLTQEEAAKISEMKGVISVNPNRIYKLHTTRSWDFMNLTVDKVVSPQQTDVIIGLLDTGVWPEHPSFNDTSFGPPPAKWKGTCSSTNFTCNNKIIGARFYNSGNSNWTTDIQSPRDSEGHGTHTATTAGGNEVEASYLGLAKGLARGGVPGSRIAVYKVCWAFGCASADILKAFDDAIADGVDIISVSLGSGYPDDYFDDPIAIGSFHALKNGILTSNSAGNNGPDPATVSNFSPWTLTVAASTIDRKFVANLVLGNGKILTGIAINTFDLNGTWYPLIWGGDAVNYTFGSSPDHAKLCYIERMNVDLLVGKIVLCEKVNGGATVFVAKGVGVVIVETRIIDPDYAFSYPLPTTLINPDYAEQVLDYIRSTEYPMAIILMGETWKDATAPKVASFSSRGPNPISPDILKPDIAAPGVDIIAGWSPLSPPTNYDVDTRSVLFNIISGTSMSCPHASATAAYVKAAHPHWSPSAIKSAIMTTAQIMDPRIEENKEFAYGSGHINPVAALDPGLVFNSSETDYINFLCKQGYNTTTLRLVTGDDSICTNTTTGRAWDLNYPSIALYVLDGQQINGTFPRTVTNVGAPNSTYTATVYSPPLFNISVEPSALAFSAVGETQPFVVTITGPAIYQQPIVSGAIMWRDSVHSVRMPVVVHNYYPGAPYTTYGDGFMKERMPKIIGGRRSSLQ